jgi:hypothetical protein
MNRVVSVNVRLPREVDWNGKRVHYLPDEIVIGIQLRGIAKDDLCVVEILNWRVQKKLNIEWTIEIWRMKPSATIRQKDFEL